MFNSGNCTTPFTMPVQPAYSGNGCGNGMNGWGGDWIWILVVFALLFGWGGNGWGNNGGGNGGGYAVPYMVGNTYTDSAVQRGFDTQTIVGKLDGINNGLCDGFYAVNTSILNAQSGIQNSLCQGFNSVNTNIMQGNFGLQQAINNAAVANMQGQNALQAQISDCCCGVQRAIDGVNYNMATNTCAITNQMNNNTRDIIESNNAGTRAILDYLCQKENADLRAENQNLRLEKSQTAQNAFIAANQSAQTAELIRRLGADCPQPAYVVQPPQPVTFPTNCCGGVNFAAYGNGYNNGSCGCGNNSGCGCC